MKKLLKSVLVTLSGCLLSACSSVGIGAQSFTIKGAIPPNVSVEFLTEYQTLVGEGCTHYVWTDNSREDVGGEVTTGKIEAKPTAQQFQVSVPLTKRLHGCKTYATGVRALIIDTRLANKQLDGFPDFVGFLGIDPYNLEPLTSAFESTINLECTRYFKLNGDIQYLYGCERLPTSTRGVFGAKDLANNTVVLNITQNQEDQPSCEKCWVKVPKGWKACSSGTNPLIDASCDTPPTFRDSFKWDGKTCTIYPGCTE